MKHKVVLHTPVHCHRNFIIQFHIKSTRLAGIVERLDQSYSCTVYRSAKLSANITVRCFQMGLLDHSENALLGLIQEQFHLPRSKVSRNCLSRSGILNERSRRYVFFVYTPVWFITPDWSIEFLGPFSI